MPQSETLIGGYVSLNEGANVYNSTTEPKRAYSVLETVKKALGQAIGSQDTNLLIDGNDSKIRIQAAKTNSR